MLLGQNKEEDPAVAVWSPFVGSAVAVDGDTVAEPSFVCLDRRYDGFRPECCGMVFMLSKENAVAMKLWQLA